MRFLEAVVQLSNTPTDAPEELSGFAKLENGRWLFDAGVAAAESPELLQALESFRLWRNRFEDRVLIGEEGWVAEMWSWSGREHNQLTDGNVVDAEECLALAVALSNMHEQLVARRFSGTMLVGDAGGVCSGHERSFSTASGVVVEFLDTQGVRFGDELIAVGETRVTTGSSAVEGLKELFPSSASVRAEVIPISNGWAAACVAVSKLALKAGTGRRKLSIRYTE